MADTVKECPSCALDVDEEAEVCPYCRYEFPRQPSARKAMAWVMALLLAWPLFELLKLLFT
jgi:hypothetical protein